MSSLNRPPVFLVVAVAENGVIGKDGAMPWHMPGDLKTFRRLTMGRPIVMGRKTFQAIGRALDGRTNVVITRDPEFSANEVLIASSFQDALALAANSPGAEKGIMVIGGGEIYRAALPVADAVYLTRIHAEPDGDTYFPALEPETWSEVSRDAIVAHGNDQHTATLIEYRRR